MSGKKSGEFNETLEKCLDEKEDSTVSMTTLLKQAEMERVKRRKVRPHPVFTTASRSAKPAEYTTPQREKNTEVYVVLTDSENDDTKTSIDQQEGVNSRTSKHNIEKFPIKKVIPETKDGIIGSSYCSSFSSTLQNTPSRSIKNDLRSTIRLISDLSEPNEEKRRKSNEDTVSLSDLIGSPDLLETYQFNFSVQLPVFLSFLSKSFIQQRRKVVFITGGTVFDSPEMKFMITKRFDVSEVTAPLPNQFASHHTKMMVNFYDNDEVEIIISTSNLMQLDLCGLTQAVWRSGRLKKGISTTTQGKRFRMDLLRYLSRYGLDVTKRLIILLGIYDFSSVYVELVASVPGVYHFETIKPNGEYYGYAKLRQVLERNDLLVKDTSMQHNILSQVTSIAYPYKSQKGNTSSVFTHILCPIMFDSWRQDLEPGSMPSEYHQERFNYKPRIIFPTMKDIAQSTLGFMSGIAVHFKYDTSAVHKAQYEQNIQKYLCKWTTPGNTTGRESVTPHVKYYACDNGDNWKSLKWVMVGSHNLSKQAWGYPKANSGGKSMVVSSYELSVLVPSKPEEKLVPVYSKDVAERASDRPVRFPFVLPPTQYDEQDQPWSADSPCKALRDRWGNTNP